MRDIILSVPFKNKQISPLIFQLHDFAGILEPAYSSLYSIKNTHSLSFLRGDRHVSLAEQVDFKSQGVELGGHVS